MSDQVSRALWATGAIAFTVVALLALRRVFDTPAIPQVRTPSTSTAGQDEPGDLALLLRKLDDERAEAEAVMPEAIPVPAELEAKESYEDPFIEEIAAAEDVAGEIEEAAEPAAENEDDKLKALLEPSEEAAATVRAIVIERASQAKGSEVFYPRGSSAARGRLVSADARGISVEDRGSEMNLPWQLWDARRLAGVASRLAAMADERYAIALFLAQNGLFDLAGRELDEAVRADVAVSSKADMLRRAFPRPTVALAPQTQRAPEGGTVIRVALQAIEPGGIGRKEWPVTTGIPFADGTLPSALIAGGAYRVVDSAGREVPSQAVVATEWGRFPGGANGFAKWVHVTTLVSVEARGRADLAFEAGPRVKNATPQGIGIESSGRGYQVSTGPLRFAVGSAGMNLFDSVSVDLNGDGRFSADELVVASAAGNMLIEHQRGRGTTSEDPSPRVEIEEKGPLRAVVKITSKYDDTFESVVRIYAYAGKSYLRVQDTLVHGPTGQGYGALANVKTVRVREHSLNLPMRLGANARAVFGGAGAAPLGNAWLEQDVNHAFQRGGGTFLYEMKTASGVAARGEKAPGWFDVSDSRFGVTASVRYFWQLFPKRLSASREGMKLELWARDARLSPEGQNDHHTGKARTHDILLAFHPGGFAPAMETTAMAHQHEVFLVCTPEYYCSTRAYGTKPLLAKPDGRFDPRVLRVAGTNGNAGFPAWRKSGDAWGYLNFGDSPLGEYWSCLEYDSPWGLLQSFYRLGDVSILRETALMSRSAYDILFRHNSTPSSSLYPQTSHDKQERHFAGGNSHGHKKGTDPGHVFISGLINYWYLTGDKRARDVIFWSLPVYLGDDRERISGGGTWRYCGGYLADIFVRAYELTWEQQYIDRLEWMCEHVFRKTPTRHQDGVWWDSSGGAFHCQPWLADSVSYGYLSYVDINPTTKYKGDIEDAVVKLADFVDRHAFSRERGAIAQGLVKNGRDQATYHDTGSYYGGFMCMISSYTFARAYTITGNRHYLDVAQELFNSGLAGWESNEAKSAGQAMMTSAATLFYLQGGTR